MKQRNLFIASICLLGSFEFADAARAEDISVPIYKVSPIGIGAALGTIVISEKPQGSALKIKVSDIPAGQHGFHIHEFASCEPGTKDGKPQAALAAGGHYDPATKKTHKGPSGEGHMGDLPVLNAVATGIDVVISLERLKLSDLRGHALMIHEGGDNYTDSPENGGGAARIACGVVPK